MSRAERIKREHIWDAIKIIATCLLALSIIWGAIKIGEKNNREYNAHVCAVYGYLPDCSTPLTQVK